MMAGIIAAGVVLIAGLCMLHRRLETMRTRRLAVRAPLPLDEFARVCRQHSDVEWQACRIIRTAWGIALGVSPEHVYPGDRLAVDYRLSRSTLFLDECDELAFREISKMLYECHIPRWSPNPIAADSTVADLVAELSKHCRVAARGPAT